MGDKVIITSRKNETVHNMKKLGESSAYRAERGEFMLEGAKLLIDAVANGAEIREVLYCGERPEDIPEGVAAQEVSRDIIEYISAQKTPQNVVFSAAIPKAEGQPQLSGAVILENIQDPGNVGTMLRTANAFGIREAILVGACADLWNPKTVRASMGAVFRERTFRLSLEELRELKKKEKVTVYGAALGEDSSDIRSAKLIDSAVAIGNEGKGLSAELLELCDKRLIIPMAPECESLNAAAAAAVFMWEMAKDNL